MKNIIIIILFFGISGLGMPCKLYCQHNYLPGYIINLKNDTVRGFIDYRNWEKNPSKIFFASDPKGVEITYSPSEIKSFVVLDEIYEGAIVERESHLNTIDNGPYTYELITEKEPVFLQTLINGEKSLFYLKDKNGIDQFYIREGDFITLLKFKRYHKLQEKGGGIIENRTFIGQLSQYLHDCPGIQEKLTHLIYRKSDLENLFLSYYNCTKEPIQFRKKHEKNPPELGALIGFANTYVKVVSDYFYLKDVKFGYSNTFSGGVFCDFTLPRSLRKISINTELIYSSYKISGHYDDNFDAATIHMGYNYCKINAALRYKYQLKKMALFTDLGVTNGIVLHEINERIGESVFHPNITSRAVNDTRSDEQGYFLGLGATIKKYSAELRFEKANGFSVYDTLGTWVKRFFFFLGYRF
ncbi:MAG: hypothetical protein ABJC12_01460 [Saprospiraceae bacterium]